MSRHLQRRLVKPCCEAVGQDFLCEFDFTALDELDPALSGGWTMMYNRQVPGEMRVGTFQRLMGSMGAVEPLNIKVLVKGTECEPEQVKIEVTSENELFLHFTHKLTRESFREICGDQNLLVDMADYPSVIMKMCNSSIQNPKTFTAVVVLHDDGGADLSFVQNIEYKFVELLRFPLVQSSEETLRQNLQFRYHCLRTKISALHARLQDVGAMVQTRNPNLWDDLIKSVGLLGNACPPIVPCYHR